MLLDGGTTSNCIVQNHQDCIPCVGSDNSRDSNGGYFTDGALVDRIVRGAVDRHRAAAFCCRECRIKDFQQANGRSVGVNEAIVVLRSNT